MPESPTDRKPSSRNDHATEILRRLVMPAFAELSCGPEGEENAFELAQPVPGTKDAPCVRSCVHEQRLIHVTAHREDDERTLLRFNMLVGHLISHPPASALILGHFLEDGPFHVRNDLALGYYGRLSIGCDLVVDAGDKNLVGKRIGELVAWADHLDWFFPLRMPNRLLWQEIDGTEIEWNDLPHNNLGGFLDRGLAAPRAERTPLTLLRLAQGLERWHDVLRLLREHPVDFPEHRTGALKCVAYRQLRRWLPAIRAARAGGILDGYYPGASRMSPSYLHALIEGGDDIEALRLLGKPSDGEPGFYDWMRGLAYQRAGDSKQAARAFTRYHEAWPGDVLGFSTTDKLVPEED